jgi:tetratricopeptide (TPR) repeat protein
VQQLTGNHPAAATSHQQALQLFRDVGERRGQADVLNSLGELAARTSATHQARKQHSQALTIARDIGVPFEEARAREGLGRAHLQDGDSVEAAAHLGRALSIYRRIGAHPAAKRVQETLHQHRLTADTVEPGTMPPRDDHPRQPPAAPPANR